MSKTLIAALVLCLLFFSPAYAESTSTETAAGLLPLGSRVTLGEEAASGLVYRVVERKADGVTLLSEDIVATRPFSSPHMSWADSALRAWLADDFLQRYPADHLAGVLITEIETQGVGDASPTLTKDRVFLPSVANLGLDPNGTAWPYFQENTKGRSALFAGEPSSYWTRTPVSSGSAAMHYVTNIGALGTRPGLFIDNPDGVRPALRVHPDWALTVLSTGETPETTTSEEPPTDEPAPVDPPKVQYSGQEEPLLIYGKIVNGRFLAPLRAVFESLGAQVGWEGTTRTVTGQRGNRRVELVIDQKEATIDGLPTALDVPPTLIDNRTYVPVRFVSEALGAQVAWDQATRTATVTLDDLRVQIKEQPSYRFTLSDEGPITLHVGDRLTVEGQVHAPTDDVHASQLRWGTKHTDIATVSGSVISGYTTTWGDVTTRFIVTAENAVVLTAESPGRTTLGATLGPFTEEKAQTLHITVIVLP